MHALWPAVVCSAMNPVGKPDAGNRHVRFDERGEETERCRMAQVTAPLLDSTALIRATSRSHLRNQKGGRKARHSPKLHPELGARAELSTPPGPKFTSSSTSWPSSPWP